MCVSISVGLLLFFFFHGRFLMIQLGGVFFLPSKSKWRIDVSPLKLFVSCLVIAIRML